MYDRRYTLVFILALATVCSVHADDAFWCDNGVQQQLLTKSLNGFLVGTEPSSWLYNHLWGSEECPCEWYGVDCSLSNDEVTLSLPNNKIYGSISSEFCANIYQSINLDNNELFARLPACIGDMNHLTSLRLQNNSFQGLLPESLGNLNKLKHLDVSQNLFSGPFPDYLACPNVYFPEKINLAFEENLFWCPTADWCSSPPTGNGECEDCEDEPSDNCTNLNAVACDTLIGCCYSNSWNSQCELIVANSTVGCAPEHTNDAPCTYKPPNEEESSDKSSDGFDYSGILWTTFTIVIVLVILALGCFAVFFITMKKRNWYFSQVKRDLVKVDSDTYTMDPDLDIYQDETPPRSSLDYEL